MQATVAFVAEDLIGHIVLIMTESEKPRKEYLTTTQVAEICGVNRATVVRWIQNGDLIAERTIGGRYRVGTEHLLNQSKENGIFIAKDMKQLLRNESVPAVDHSHNNNQKTSGKEFDKVHILIIDDDQYIRQLLDEYLTLIGYNVILADNGFKGLDILLTDYTIKLVILDLLMPGISGLETLRKVKTMRNDVPIIITSGFIEYYFPDGEETLKGDVDLIIRKPFDLDHLANCCKKLLVS